MENNTMQYSEELEKLEKLDLETWLYLYLTKAKIKKHLKIENLSKKREFSIGKTQKNEVYIFKNYDEYRNFFLMYLDDVENELIDLAIYTRGNKGQIVALRGLCERIIIKVKNFKFYQSITKEQVEEIHSKGNLTSLEFAQLCINNNLCVISDKSLTQKDRGNFFDRNCQECLLENATHRLEYENPALEQKANTINSPKRVLNKRNNFIKK